MISGERGFFDEAMAPLTGTFGEVDCEGEVMDFDFTDYYEAEMGRGLYRKFISFSEPVTPEALIAAKLMTNELECDIAGRSAGGPRRPINLDPGYVASSKLVLGSMKNFSHRIYLGRGVYAEVTLMWHNGAWEPLPWTFPDFASGRYHPFLTEVRSGLHRQLHEEQR